MLKSTFDSPASTDTFCPVSRLSSFPMNVASAELQLLSCQVAELLGNRTFGHPLTTLQSATVFPSLVVNFPSPYYALGKVE
jgi:hypothetical protein